MRNTSVYDVQFRYANSPIPTTVARRVSVAPGRSSVVTLDSGIRMKPAQATDVTGWDLVPAASSAPSEADEQEGAAAAPDALVQARPPHGNKSSLWMPYAVPPGVYTLLVHVKGMDEPLPLEEHLQIRQGELIEFDSGL